jgi:hypothetical protein
VGREGVEPSTSRLSGVRSNHLSYRPNLLGRSGPARRGLGGFAGEAAGGACRAEGAQIEDSTGSALFGGAYRDRTDDLLNAIQSLSQLS